MTRLWKVLSETLRFSQERSSATKRNGIQQTRARALYFQAQEPEKTWEMFVLKTWKSNIGVRRAEVMRSPASTLKMFTVSL